MSPTPSTAATASGSAPVISQEPVLSTGSAAEPVLHFEQMGRSFAGRCVLRDITLSVYQGEVIAILGPSGCGKSTLLRGAAGLDTGFSGEISIAGSAVRSYEPRTAVAFQEPRLLPWRSIADNVDVGLPRGLSRSERRSRVAHLLEMVGLNDRAQLRPREISGGMAQRVSLARALAREPQVLLLDEPFGALDALTRVQMQDFLLSLQAKISATALLVTHDVDEALLLADRIVVLGHPEAGAAATILKVHTVPGQRPRDRQAPELNSLRSELFASLGVERH